MIIRIRQLQDPTFCTKPRDEVIVLPCSVIPEASDDNINMDMPEMQDLELREEQEECSFENSENQVPHGTYIPPRTAFI